MRRFDYSRLGVFALCMLFFVLGALSFFDGSVEGRGPSPIVGSGNAGRIAKFVTVDTIENSVIRENNGNVGVNATHPSIRFLVHDGRLGVNVTTDGNLGGLIANQNGGGPIASFRRNVNNVEMIIENDGSVGIGTDTPTEKLTVDGTIESTLGGVKFPDGTLQSTAFESSRFSSGFALIS